MVKVHTSTVNAADLETLRGTWLARFGGPLRPMHKILGTDIAGRVETNDEIWGDLSLYVVAALLLSMYVLS